MDEQSTFFEDIRKIAEHIHSLSRSVWPEYKRFVDDVISERITDIHEIERTLDYMLTFCSDEEILKLFKAVLRKIYYKDPDLVKSYVTTYFEMYGDDTNEMEKAEQ